MTVKQKVPFDKVTGFIWFKQIKYWPLYIY